MVKKNIGKKFDIYPMPVVIVGTVTDEKPNFMTVAWITKLSPDPSLLGISVGAGQHSAKGIQQTGQFSVNFPSVEEMELADYCGLVHGNVEDKSAHVDVFRGSLEHAPMVRQCPLNLECRLKQTVELRKTVLLHRRSGQRLRQRAYPDRRPGRSGQVPPLRADHARQQLLGPR